MPGTIMAAASRGRPVLNPIPVANAIHITASPADPTAEVVFSSNGAGVSTNGSGVSNWDWARNPVAGIGANFWVRATVTAGVTPSGSAVGVWLSIAGFQSWGVSRSTPGTTSSTLTFEIARDSAGTSIVGTATGVTLTATELS